MPRGTKVVLARLQVLYTIYCIRHIGNNILSFHYFLNSCDIFVLYKFKNMSLCIKVKVLNISPRFLRTIDTLLLIFNE